jgi:negative regulator of sigma-B (phosphoserine phosphatase)
MTDEDAGAGIAEIGIATSPAPGQTSSGDVAVVELGESGLLIAAIDGLGHGDEAAVAADLAASILRADPAASFDELLRRCHEALLRTRGAVATLARIDERDGTLTWVGVGNVEGRLVRVKPRERGARDSVFLFGGALGFRLPSIRSTTLALESGDTLVLATDGVKRDFAEALPADVAAQESAQLLLASHGRGGDDALVVVARYLGAGGP